MAPKSACRHGAARRVSSRTSVPSRARRAGDGFIVGWTREEHRHRTFEPRHRLLVAQRRGAVDQDGGRPRPQHRRPGPRRAWCSPHGSKTRWRRRPGVVDRLVEPARRGRGGASARGRRRQDDLQLERGVDRPTAGEHGMPVALVAFDVGRWHQGRGDLSRRGRRPRTRPGHPPHGRRRALRPVILTWRRREHERRSPARRQGRRAIHVTPVRAGNVTLVVTEDGGLFAFRSE